MIPRPLRHDAPSPAPMRAEDVPTRMRAAVIDSTGAPELLHETELPVPQPVLGELLVRVVAAGVNPIDAKTRAGQGVSGAIATYPAALGFDFSGVVVASPFEAHPLPAGTEVFGMVPFPRTGGTYAEYVVVPSQSLARKPASLSHVEAAGIPLAALTAWGVVVETAHAHEGQRVLIHAGSGGVGHFAVQLAAYFGAHVTVTSSARNAAWLRELGASVVIDYATTRFEDVVADMDVVIDLVANTEDEVGTRSLGVIRPGGLYIMVPSGGWPGFAEAAAQAGVRATGYKVIPDGDVLATLARLLDTGSIQVYIDTVYELADAAEAHRALERGRTRGKSVLRITEA
ncbi:NADPH:quinone reductase-like Zn-dependent oxidoreductase [Microbacterium sp. SORGH_AS428]|uniref:NADP-dependent oxidoreductase n=1 Tax=Microbacterium sp. SORGH_AS_0428 TaxID=3041788 RepID=UPI00285610D8|nr:NADP-dependent oxidoreductase [Microbacterium sp. SORGH_AS_0428]MDR6200624.1 NADPH:quinone reductase-like Zn-dependent oxidoreductase [Microbacterium sp. SORGH_AS_0428]